MEKLPQIKLIVSDMDGTLLNNSHQLPSDFYGIYHQLKEKNILFVPASGRQFFNLQEVFQKIKNEIAFIAENGTYVYAKGREISHSSIDKSTYLPIFEAVRQIPNTHLVFCGINGAYYESEDGIFLSHVANYYSKRTLVENLDSVDDLCLKVAIFNADGTEKNVYPDLAHYADELQVVVSGEVWLDIMHSGANKGTALTNLQEKLSILPEETMVFGDYMNDLEMLKLAKYSFAMKNAHPVVKEISNFETELTNEECGVTETIKTLIL